MKVYNEMKERWEDDSLPEWQKYYADLKAHEEKYAAIQDAYDKEFLTWSFNESVSAPNKPGYLFANND